MPAVQRCERCEDPCQPLNGTWSCGCSPQRCSNIHCHDLQCLVVLPDGPRATFLRSMRKLILNEGQCSKLVPNRVEKRTYLKFLNCTLKAYLKFTGRITRSYYVQHIYLLTFYHHIIVTPNAILFAMRASILHLLANM